LTKVKREQTADVDHTITEFFRSQSPELDCELGHDWQFDQIERDANLRQGHITRGTVIESPPHQLVIIAHELEASLIKLHPNLSARALAAFWRSWRVWRHLAEASEEIGAQGEALQFVYRQLSTYAHELKDAIPPPREVSPIEVSPVPNSSNPKLMQPTGGDIQNDSSPLAKSDQKARMSKYETFKWRGQTKYKCPFCPYDHYDEATVDEHVRWCPDRLKGRQYDPISARKEFEEAEHGKSLQPPPGTSSSKMRSRDAAKKSTTRGHSADEVMGERTGSSQSQGRIRKASSGQVVKTGEQLRAHRIQLLTAAQERWRPKAGRRVPFAWVHKQAGVDHKDAYMWKSGKLSDKSMMTTNIERVLKSSDPPGIRIPTANSGEIFPIVPTNSHY
jgi:hypothetical protein